MTTSRLRILNVLKCVICPNLDQNMRAGTGLVYTINIYMHLSHPLDLRACVLRCPALTRGYKTVSIKMPRLHAWISKMYLKVPRPHKWISSGLSQGAPPSRMDIRRCVPRYPTLTYGYQTVCLKVHPETHTRDLRSSDQNVLFVPRINMVEIKMEEESFSAAAQNCRTVLLVKLELPKQCNLSGNLFILSKLFRHSSFVSWHICCVYPLSFMLCVPFVIYDVCTLCPFYAVCTFVIYYVCTFVIYVVCTFAIYYVFTFVIYDVCDLCNLLCVYLCHF